jgi:hypothetical protein
MMDDGDIITSPLTYRSGDTQPIAVRRLYCNFQNFPGIKRSEHEADYTFI